jgi:hypothetical protein
VCVLPQLLNSVACEQATHVWYKVMQMVCCRGYIQAPESHFRVQINAVRTTQTSLYSSYIFQEKLEVQFLVMIATIISHEFRDHTVYIRIKNKVDCRYDNRCFV